MNEYCFKSIETSEHFSFSGIAFNYYKSPYYIVVKNFFYLNDQVAVIRLNLIK